MILKNAKPPIITSQITNRFIDASSFAMTLIPDPFVGFCSNKRQVLCQPPEHRKDVCNLLELNENSQRQGSKAPFRSLYKVSTCHGDIEKSAQTGKEFCLANSSILSFKVYCSMSRRLNLSLVIPRHSHASM